VLLVFDAIIHICLYLYHMLLAMAMTADLGYSFLKEHTCCKANPRSALGGGVVPEEGVVDAATGMGRAPTARGARS